MELRDFLAYDRIVIQCHDDPDADAFASGFAVWTYLRDHGKAPRFVYSGRSGSLKPNLAYMRDALGIPAEYVTELEEPDLLILADCQYGERNVRRFPAKTVAVIDHHQVRDRAALPPMSEVRENYGSCATVVYGMLLRDGCGLSGKTKLQTALYYGLYMDTSQFQELWHPADRDMWDALVPDEAVLGVLKNTNIASADLHAIGEAFAAHEVDGEHRFAVAEVKTKDRNILGIVSDTLLQVDVIDACVVYASMGDVVRFSARSCVKEIRADELAAALAAGIGSAGGHRKKAAGVFFRDELERRWPGTSFPEVLKGLLRDYFEQTQTVVSAGELDLESFAFFRKRPVEAGVADLSKAFAPGTKVMLRTLEGDIDLTVDPEQLLMIGVGGEAYPIRRDTFEKNYERLEEPYRFSGDYVPAVRDYRDGRPGDLPAITFRCRGKGTSLVLAKQLEKRTHVFTVWDRQKYIFGRPGDWIAVRGDNRDDVYIIAEDIFTATYDRAEQPD